MSRGRQWRVRPCPWLRVCVQTRRGCCAVLDQKTTPGRLDHRIGRAGYGRGRDHPCTGQGATGSDRLPLAHAPADLLPRREHHPDDQRRPVLVFGHRRPQPTVGTVHHLAQGRHPDRLGAAPPRGERVVLRVADQKPQRPRGGRLLAVEQLGAGVPRRPRHEDGRGQPAARRDRLLAVPRPRAAPRHPRPADADQAPQALLARCLRLERALRQGLLSRRDRLQRADDPGARRRGLRLGDRRQHPLRPRHQELSPHRLVEPLRAQPGRRGQPRPGGQRRGLGAAQQPLGAKQGERPLQLPPAPRSVCRSKHRRSPETCGRAWRPLRGQRGWPRRLRGPAVPAGDGPVQAVQHRPESAAVRRAPS